MPQPLAYALAILAALVFIASVYRVLVWLDPLDSLKDVLGPPEDLPPR